MRDLPKPHDTLPADIADAIYKLIRACADLTPTGSTVTASSKACAQSAYSARDALETVILSHLNGKVQEKPAPGAVAGETA